MLPLTGLGEGSVNGLQFGSDGALWVATEGGLSRMKDGRITTLTSKNGLPCDAVHWSMEDDDHSFWLYMSCGLVRIARLRLGCVGLRSEARFKTTVFDSSDGVRSMRRLVLHATSVEICRMEEFGSRPGTA